jgi:hypothetical protein
LLAKIAGRTHYPDVFVSKQVDTPMVIGGLASFIVLPCQDYSDTEIKYILQHELYHYHRHDVAIKWITVAAWSLHWFNPLMLLIRHEIEMMCEYSCDESVTYNMDAAERKAYIRTILKTAIHQANLNIVLPTAMSGDAKKLEQRFIAIMEQKHFTLAKAITSVVTICLVLAIGFSLGSFTFLEKQKNTIQTSPPTHTKITQITEKSSYEPTHTNSTDYLWYQYGYERMNYEFTNPDAVFDEKQKAWTLPYEDGKYEYKPTLIGGTEDYAAMCSVFNLLNFENYERIGETMTMTYFSGDALYVGFYNELYFYWC